MTTEPKHIQSAKILREQAITEAISLENQIEGWLRDVQYIRRLLEKSEQATAKGCK